MSLRRRVALVAGALALLAAPVGTPSLAKDAEMSFKALPPDAALAPLLGTAWTIFASGPIDGLAAERLKSLMETENIPAESHLYLHSPGGDLFGGMELGKVIREYRLRTNIGRHAPDSRYSRSSSPGSCFSACAMAFLGGHFRFLSGGSRFGVHRFALTGSPSHASDIAQVLSAVVVEYIRSMDVDVGLFTLTTSAAPTEMFEPSTSQLLALNIVNNGRTKAAWTLESTGDSLYVKGEQDTVHGMNKFMVICDEKRRRLLYIIFDPRRREEEVMMMLTDTLMVDGKKYPLQQHRISRKVHNGWINAIYRLSDAHASLIARANRVGVIMRFGPDAPVFFGFDSMPVGDGSSKLQGLLSACR